MRLLRCIFVAQMKSIKQNNFFNPLYKQWNLSDICKCYNWYCYYPIPLYRFRFDLPARPNRKAFVAMQSHPFYTFIYSLQNVCKPRQGECGGLDNHCWTLLNLEFTGWHSQMPILQLCRREGHGGMEILVNWMQYVVFYILALAKLSL